MNQFSISLGKILGIRMSIHWTFWILIIWIVVSNANQGQGQSEIIWYLLFVFAVFGCVVLHEFGHALAARRYGIQTESITILPIGGLASLERIPEAPKQELVVAAAGPMVNVVIAFLLWIFLSQTGNFLIDPETLTAINSENFLFALFGVNIVLVVFNLIPAFPMDGGRMLRALLSFKMSRLKATEWAVSIGKFFAILFVFWGFSNNPFLIFIALFIVIAASGELHQVRSKSLLKGHVVKDILHQDFHLLNGGQAISDAVKLLLDVQDHHFLITENKEVVGTLSKTAIIQGLTKHGENIPVRQVMQKNILWLKPDMPIVEAQEAMLKKGISVAPVRVENRLIGILEMENLNEFLLVQAARNKGE